MKPGNHWNLMATHGIVLFYIAANPDTTMRQMSEALDLTERRIAQVVRDLADSDYIEVTRNGRRNSYTVNPDAQFRHPTLSHLRLGKFVSVLTSLPVLGLGVMQAAAPHAGVANGAI
jgi:predicted transcriptional regulator